MFSEFINPPSKESFEIWNLLMETITMHVPLLPLSNLVSIYFTIIFNWLHLHKIVEGLYSYFGLSVCVCESLSVCVSVCKSVCEQKADQTATQIWSSQNGCI